jgi:ribosomal protein S27AE
MSPACGKEWTRKHIREIFTLVFINGPLREHREKVLFDKERALLPATQPIIEGKILAKKIDEEIIGHQKRISLINREIAVLYQQKTQALTRKSKTTERSAFVRACPDEDCRGFLSTQWKCGICEKWTCPECHIIKGYTRDAEHVCNPDDVATAQLIAADTKPCPQCGTGIFKIDGCDQMWCTQCHTAFSWRTGRVEQNIHNPHYFEWQRRTGGQVIRNPNDVICGRNLDHYLYESFSRLLRTNYSDTPNYRQILSRMDNTIRHGIHILHVERPTEPNYERRNEDLRVQYLMKEITEEEMRALLQRDDKRHHRNQELAEIYTLLVNTVTDILYRFYDELNTHKHEDHRDKNIDTTILFEIDTIVDYANECLADISYTYSCSRLIIENNLHILRGNNAARYIREKAAIEPAPGAALENVFIDR